MDNKQLEVISDFICKKDLVEPNIQFDFFRGFTEPPLSLKLNTKYIVSNESQLANGACRYTLDNRSISQLLFQIEEVYQLTMKKEFQIDRDVSIKALNVIYEQDSDPDDHSLFRNFSPSKKENAFKNAFNFPRKRRIYLSFVRGLLLNYKDLRKIYNNNGICQFDYNPREKVTYFNHICEIKPSEPKKNAVYAIHKMWMIYLKGGRKNSYDVYIGIKNGYQDFINAITKIRCIDSAHDAIENYRNARKKEMNQIFVEIEFLSNQNNDSLSDEVKLMKIIAFTFMNIACIGHGNNTGSSINQLGTVFTPSVVSSSGTVFIIHFSQFYQEVLPKIKTRIVEGTCDEDISISSLDFIKDYASVHVKCMEFVNKKKQELEDARKSFETSKEQFIQKLKETPLAEASGEREAVKAEEKAKAEGMVEGLKEMLGCNIKIENGCFSFKAGPFKGNINFANIIGLVNDFRNLSDRFNKLKRLHDYEELGNLISFYVNAIIKFEVEKSVAIEVSICDNIHKFKILPVIIQR